tara:strand:- start:80189 stop:81241 length:1053 start_codon:yes stop_codon:yes gene_type:complete
MYRTSDTRISDRNEVISANELLAEQPLSEKSTKVILDSRKQISEILHKIDSRLIVIVGPCSIHDPKAAIDYAVRLKEVSDKLNDDLHIVMRVYFEKPRTTVGWKGLINDPDLNDTFNINKGLKIARGLLREINDLGLSAGTEFLDVITPQYIGDLVSWGAIGARTTESQIHRELASGLSCPIGFKNSTYGGIQVAADAIGSSSNPHRFLSVTKEGKVAIFTSSGNKDTHVILRGGTEPNYDEKNIEKTSEVLKASNLEETIMVDMSHGNSRKQHKNQLEVSENICKQITSGERRITGVMIESNIEEGNQPNINKKDLVYGKSITDACINWADTEKILKNLAKSIRDRNNK